MATSISLLPNTPLSPFSGPTTRSRTTNPFLRRTHFTSPSNHKPFLHLRSSLTIARFGLGQVPLLDPDITGWLTGDPFARPESLVYTIAADASPESFKPSNDWISGWTFHIDTVLEVLKKGLSTLHVPYAYGFAIILFAILVNAATFPLKKKSIEVSMAIQSLRPLENAILRRYASDDLASDDLGENLTGIDRLYKQFGLDFGPGYLLTLAKIAVTTGLYRTLSDVTDGGLLTEGFFRIPSLTGPITTAARQSGSGISWLFPFIDGEPPLGWSDTLAYLVLPFLLGLSKYLIYTLRSPEEPEVSDYVSTTNLKSSAEEPEGRSPDCEEIPFNNTWSFVIQFNKTIQFNTTWWVVMFGFISLFVPSGLSLYWIMDTILDDAQEEWLIKRGAENPLKNYHHDISLVKHIQERPTSYGPRPGDRFRQLKKQEARRQQREEEQKKD